ncbi:MAG: CPBP family intramembrane metalloprotease [Anaerolineales bacterium]|nr:CPBP family intramembrane metalloprotease [Anaerolineales bacterium]
MTVFFALAMWGPGIAAMVANRISGRPFSALRLNTLGPKRYYLWALFLFPVLSLLTILTTILIGAGHFDVNFTLIREAMADAPGVDRLDIRLILAIQIVSAVLVAPFFNSLLALGEELGWRGFLLPRLMPLGQWPAILLSGVIWGFWHAPAVVQGLNYPGYPILGIFMMIVFCVLAGIILSWLYLNTRSPWSAALGHGSINAVAGLPVMFLVPGLDMAFGGTLSSVAGWIPLLLFVVWTMWIKKRPFQPLEKEGLELS